MTSIILYLIGYRFIKFFTFCSMLYILFAPHIMWVYIGIILGYSIIEKVVKRVSNR